MDPVALQGQPETGGPVIPEAAEAPSASGQFPSCTVPVNGSSSAIQHFVVRLEKTDLGAVFEPTVANPITLFGLRVEDHDIRDVDGHFLVGILDAAGGKQNRRYVLEILE